MVGLSKSARGSAVSEPDPQVRSRADQVVRYIDIWFIIVRRQFQNPPDRSGFATRYVCFRARAREAFWCKIKPYKIEAVQRRSARPRPADLRMAHGALSMSVESAFPSTRSVRQHCLQDWARTRVTGPSGLHGLDGGCELQRSARVDKREEFEWDARTGRFSDDELASVLARGALQSTMSVGHGGKSPVSS